MKIATEHAKRQRVRTRKNVEERFFLSRIASQGGDVVYRHAQLAAFIETNFTDAAFAGLNQATVTARITLQCAGVEVFGEFGRTLSGHRIENICEWRAGTAYWHY
jgi:hypothetical protein